MAAPKTKNKLYGIVDVIVQSVRDKSIDIHYVFTKDFAKQYGYHDDDFQDFFELLRYNWYDSLPYINSLTLENRIKEFGAITLTNGYLVDGANVACCIIKNIFAGFCMTGKMFLQMDFSHAIVPNILFDEDDFWEDRTDFIYISHKGKKIHFTARSILDTEDLQGKIITSKTDLMQLFRVVQSWEDDKKDNLTWRLVEHTDNELPKEITIKADEVVNNDDEPHLVPLNIYGFMASLIHAMCRDIVRRKIFNVNWYDENWAITVPLTATNINLLSYKDLPKNLHIPAIDVIDAYFETAFEIMQNKLHFKESAYEYNPEYVIKNILNVELNQRKLLNNSLLWKNLPKEVQQMLLKYLDIYINFLRKRSGAEEPAHEQTNIASKAAINHEQSLPFFVPEKLKELGTLTYEQFCDKYREAVQSDAPKLAKFLHRYEKLKVFDFSGYRKREVLETLQAYFPEMKEYKYNNFVTYF